jgi:hypothetical protein
MTQVATGATVFWLVGLHAWFTFEIFFRYHETNGEFYASIKRDGRPKQTIADFKGQTKFGTKLHDQMMFKLYIAWSP